MTTTGLWLTPFLIHRIGQRDYGLWLVGLQILTWLGLTDLGIVALLPRETAYALGRAGSAKLATDLPELLAKTARIVLWQWPFVASIAATCCFLTYRESPDLFGPIAIVAGTFVITFHLRMFRAVLEGLQEFHLIGVVTISSWAVSVAATAALTVQGFHLYALAVGRVTSQLLSSVTYLTCVRVKYPYVFPRQWTRKHQNATRFQFQRGIWISLSQIAAVLIDATDLSIIGRTMGSRSVVPYSCTGKLIGVLTNQPLMILHAASPGLSEIKSGSSRVHAFRVVMNLTQAMLLLSGAVVCVVLAANQALLTGG